MSSKTILFWLVLVIAAFRVFYLWQKDTRVPDNKPPSYDTSPAVVAKGEILFSRHCKSCHSIQGDGIGPPVGGITTLLSSSFLVHFIRDPASSINATPRSVRQRELYHQVMPAFAHLKDNEINTILSYIDHQTKTLHLEPLMVDTTAVVVTPTRLVTPVKSSDLRIELEDFARIPRSRNAPDDKGIATLRAHPSGNGVLLVGDQTGVIYRVHGPNVTSYLLLRSQFPDFIDTPGIGTGLGSFSFHPDYLKNGLLYTTHAERFSGKPAINDHAFPDSLAVGLQWVLTEWKVKDVTLVMFEGTHREILRINTPTTAHGVQDIGFATGLGTGDNDYGMLYIGIGDGGSNNIKHPELCHNLHSLLGTIIRIDPLGHNGPNKKYGIPATNPFVREGDRRTRREIWAYGFRNPHRFCWDANGKRMFVADIGESNIEEVDVVQAGGDYGWSQLEGNYGISTKNDLKHVYSLRPSERTRYRGPYGQYDHLDGNAISGGFVYRGPLREMNARYFFGDIVTGKLFYMNIDLRLSDSTIYEIAIVDHGKKTSLKEITQLARLHLRIGYDEFGGRLFLMTKGDGMIRRIRRIFNESPGH